MTTDFANTDFIGSALDAQQIVIALLLRYEYAQYQWHAVTGGRWDCTSPIIMEI